MYAPIVTFVYNRVDHAEALFTSLSKCDLAKESDLFVFSDGPKSEKGVEKVAQVREYLEKAGLEKFFRSVTIVKAEKNKGLAKSVVSGVNQVIQEYGNVIVIEDDNVVSSHLLSYMNQCLGRYEKDSRIWCISGYSFKDKVVDVSEDVFFSHRPNSYLWGTWLNRWETIDWEVKDYRKFAFNPLKRRKFNRYGNDASGMLDDQMLGNVDSWAIRFYYACFKRNGMCVMPNRTLSVNFGNDGSGTHLGSCGQRDSRQMEGEKRTYKLVEPYEDDRVIQAYNIKTHRKMLYRIMRYCKTVILGRKDKR